MILRRIIVADDEILQRNVLTKILKKITPETEITACANGKEVYEELQNNGADLVITDICMPVMDGMELIRQMRPVRTEMGSVPSWSLSACL